MARALGLVGAACWVVVILTHVAEHWNLLPGMGWGLPHSPGHYLDLFSAIGGALLLGLALVVYRFSQSASKFPRR